MADGKSFFIWHAHQRWVIETIIYLYEAEGLRHTEQYAALISEGWRAQRAALAKIGLQVASSSGKTQVMSLFVV